MLTTHWTRIALLVLVAAGSSFSQLCSYGSDSEGAEWTSYLNGSDRAGATKATLPKDLKLSWTYRSQAKPEKAWSGSRTTPIEGHIMLPRVTFDASPQLILSKGKVYFGSTVDHKLHCFDAATGTPVWSFYTDGPIRLAPTLAHGHVYFGSDDGYVYCLNADDGALRWSMRVGPKDDRLLSRGEMISRWPVRTGVLVDGNTAYFGAGVFPHESVYLCAADALTGKLLWKNDRISQEDAGRNDLSPQGYLLGNDKHLYVPSGRSLPVAFSKETGEIVFQRKYSWRTDAGGVVGGTKAVLGDGQVYAGGPHHFLAMDENDGSLGAGYIGGRLMVLTDGNAFLLDGTKVFSVNRAEHAEASKKKQEWFLKARAVAKDPDRLAEAQGKIKEYAGVGVLWEYPCELDGTMIATQNLVIVGGKDKVVAIDRNSGELAFEKQVQGNAMGLAATDGYLAVSTDEGYIYCFSSTGASESKQWPQPFTEAFAKDDVSEYYQQTAQEILSVSGQRTGYCLVLGSEDGRLAYELAKQSDLMVIGVEPNAEKVRSSRLALERAGLHATEATIVHSQFDQLPFSNYFANLVVSDTHLTTGEVPCDAELVARFLKPCGGVAMLGQPASTKLQRPMNQNATADWVDRLYRLHEGEVSSVQGWKLQRRGKLPGAGEWTHQYGNAANTSFANDQRIRDGLGVLWYGDPGPSAMINRHEAAGAPLSTNGRMFIQGTDSIMAYDAYNGNFLWDVKNPGAIRTGVFNNRETHNLAATDEVLFMAIGKVCQELDGASGKLVHEYKTPSSPDGIERNWAYVACDRNQLFGTSTIRQELEEKMRRRGLTVTSQTDGIFAYDTTTHELLWTYRGKNLLHTTIALGPEHVYFIDSSITPEARQELYRRDKGELKNLSEGDALKAEQEMKALDVRLAVALDRKTGEKLWEHPVDVTDTTNVSAGGGSLTVMYADGKLLLCGANANGHYWKQFLAGEFEKRKLLVLDATNGEQLWTKNANYMNRPTIVEGKVFAEPWAFELATGETIKRPHPLTAEESDWRFSRPGHHCGIVTATPNMMFFRSGFIGYYDIYQDSGTKHFAGQRLGCWVNAIPGNGLVMIPEASAGCVCQFSIASTVVLEPKSESKSWGIFSAVGDPTPVKRMGINLGAPGDRKDAARQEWLGYPRPKAVERLEFVFDIQARFSEGGGWYSRNPDSVQTGSKEMDWIVASGSKGLEYCSIPLLGKDDGPTKYNVKLLFSEMTPEQVAGVTIRLNGQTLDSSTQKTNVNVDSVTTVVSRTFSSVPVENNLVMEFQPTVGTLPTLAAIEITREDASAKKP